MIRRDSILCALICVLGACHAFAQEKDTASLKILDNKIAREIIGAVTTNGRNDLAEENLKSEIPFRQHSGKIIRRIIFRQIGFEKSIYDSTKTIRNTVTRIANALHSDTREQVIRDNLFFREKRPLNPYRLADNERYLRDLDFIVDSKIIVIPVPGVEDSVDVEVMTRDVFSLGGRARVSGVDKFSVGIYDANLAGWGQRVQGDFLFEADRTPVIGKGFLYTKSSLGGTLINLSAGYTELNTARSSGEEYEYAYYLRLDRPLVSPYSRMAGGIEFSENWSRNVFGTSDSLFLRYKYNVQDYWIGYNIGIKNNMDDRNRHFVALRYAQQHFGTQPSQEVQRARRIYNDNKFLLAEFTFYNQNFYKTNFIYGFGRTEDVPYGQTVNVTAGWAEELGLRRLYVGSSASKRIVRPAGRFYDIEVGAGGFFNRDIMEDGALYVKGSYYSKLYNINKSRIRHLFQGGYARTFNPRVREPLTLENEINGFRADSLFGFHRIFLRNETTVFTRHHLLGFRLAPFMSLEAAYFERNENEVIRRNLYWGTTGGLRVRNENLIFGTIELRAFYFPTTVAGVDRFSFRVTTNVRIKYTGVFVRPPGFVVYN
jgi:hypothetical protein